MTAATVGRRAAAFTQHRDPPPTCVRFSSNFDRVQGSGGNHICLLFTIRIISRSVLLLTGNFNLRHGNSKKAFQVDYLSEYKYDKRALFNY